MFARRSAPNLSAALRHLPLPGSACLHAREGGKQAQVDFAEFTVTFTDEPEITRKVWLFSMVLGHSRYLWGRFVSSQNLQSVMRCHIAAFDAMGGSPEHILYDRMKTAVIGEDESGVVTYNTSLVALLNR
jgi:transposase